LALSLGEKRERENRMNRRNRVGSTASIALVAAIATSICASTWAQAPVGKLAVTRQVYTTPGVLELGSSYLPARQNQKVVNGQGLRTLKRSGAEITFNDNSLLRVSERTDLVVRDAATLRTIQREGGSVWVRVTKGTKTQVATPTVTLSARGTVFVVEQDGKEKTLLHVLEGIVEAIYGDKTVTVKEGESLEVTANTGPGGDLGERFFGVPLPTPAPVLLNSWWEDVAKERGSSVFVGTNEASTTLLSSPLVETENGLTDLPVRTDLTQNLVTFPINAILRSRQTNIQNRITPSSARVSTNTQGDSLPFLVGALAAVGAQKGDFANNTPTWQGAVSTFSSRPWGYQGRLGAEYALDKGRVLGVGKVLEPTKVVLQADAGRILTHEVTGYFGRWDTVAFVEKPLNEQTTLFAGRRRFYHGATFINSPRITLIGTQFTGVGLTHQAGFWKGEAALVQDADAERDGRQAGFLASVWNTNSAGIIGAHLLHDQKNGAGYSLTATYPVLLNNLDMYGEMGRRPTGEQIRTLGVYFPWLYQKYDIDMALEYNHRQGDLPSTSFVVQKPVKKDLNARIFATRTSRDTLLGLGATVRFGNNTGGK
jgi:hypothetical protein